MPIRSPDSDVSCLYGCCPQAAEYVRALLGQSVEGLLNELFIGSVEYVVHGFGQVAEEKIRLGPALFFNPWPVFSPMVRTPAAFPAWMSRSESPIIQLLFQIDVKTLCRLQDHTRTGLSAAAFFLEGGIFSGESTIRVMRAVVDGIDKSTLMPEFSFHLVVDLLKPSISVRFLAITLWLVVITLR